MNSYFNDFEPNKDTFGNELPDIKGLVRSKESGDKIFLIKDGFKHWVTSPEVLKELGFSFGQETFIDRADLQKFRSGEPIRIENVDQFKVPPDASQMSVSDDKEAEEGAILAPELPQNQEISQETIIFPAHKEEGEKEPHVIKGGLTSIIIPALFNSYQMLHLTGDCIGQIREHTDKNKTPYEIILIINGTSLISKENTHADKVIENKENMGYAYAVNQGIRVSQGEYICVMNNDVKVYEHWLEDMKEALVFKDLIMATPMYSRDDPWMRGIESQELREAQMQVDIQETFSEFQDFSCVLMKRIVVETIGVFDERYFYSCEDLDFLKRMKDVGLTYASSKRVRTHHISSATDLPDKGKILDESKAEFAEKWG